MTELRFLTLVTIAAFRAVDLIRIEVEHGANFQLALLHLGIHLEIRAKGSREIHITPTKVKDAIRQLQLLK